jgi:hypothetical protein
VIVLLCCVVGCMWCDVVYVGCIWDGQCLCLRLSSVLFCSVLFCCVALDYVIRCYVSLYCVTPHDIISLTSFTVYPVHPLRTGTTASGLRAGKPTWICPFFGDQFFWGEMIKKGGLGPSPCSIRQLTLHIVAESLLALQDVTVSSRE